NWAFYDCGNNIQSTIVPINYRLIRNTYCYTDDSGQPANPVSDPARATDNWAVEFGFKSNHSGGTNFVFADGPVHFITQRIDHRSYQLVGCRNDGLVVAIP